MNVSVMKIVIVNIWHIIMTIVHLLLVQITRVG